MHEGQGVNGRKPVSQTIKCNVLCSQINRHIFRVYVNGCLGFEQPSDQMQIRDIALDDIGMKDKTKACHIMPSGRHRSIIASLLKSDLFDLIKARFDIIQSPFRMTFEGKQVYTCMVKFSMRYSRIFGAEARHIPEPKQGAGMVMGCR